MWSLTANWGGFGGMVAKDWKQRARSTEQMYGQVFGAVSQIPGLRVFPRLDPPLPTPGQYDVELVMQSDAPPEQMVQTAGAVVGAGWQSGKFLYVDTDLKMDLPEARVVVDREQVADLGLDLARVGQELGTLLGGAYVNRFNYFDRSYKVIPQIGEEDRATVGPLLDLKIKTPSGQLVPVSTFTHIEIERGAAHPEPVPAAQRRPGLRRSQAGRHEGRRVAGPRGRCRRGGWPGVILDYAGESRQIRREGGGAHGDARLRGRADLSGAGGAVQELPRPADRPAGLRAAGDLRRAAVQLSRPHHHQHLLPGRADHAGGTDREERDPDRAVRQHAAGAGYGEAGGAARGVVDPAAAGADDLGGHGLRALPAGARVRAGIRSPQQHRHGAGRPG